MSIKGDNIMDDFKKMKDKVTWGNGLIWDYKDNKEDIPAWIWDKQWTLMKNYIEMLEDIVEKSEIEIHKLNSYIESFGTQRNNSTPTPPEPVDEIECPWKDDKNNSINLQKKKEINKWKIL